MTVLNILIFPNKELKKKANNIYFIDNKILKIISNLIDTMNYHKALGIAATQVSIKKKIIIINMSNTIFLQSLVIINPKILAVKDISINEEGCLSFPKIFLNIKRHKYILVKFLDINGLTHYLKIKNMISICFQHEIDHLNGITMYDKLDNKNKKYILKKII